MNHKYEFRYANAREWRPVTSERLTAGLDAFNLKGDRSLVIASDSCAPSVHYRLRVPRLEFRTPYEPRWKDANEEGYTGEYPGCTADLHKRARKILAEDHVRSVTMSNGCEYRLV